MSISKTKKNASKRPLGQFRGQIWISPDFDAPMELIESDKLRLLEAEAARGRKRKAKSRRTVKKKSSRR